MSIAEQGGSPGGFREALSRGFDKLLWGMYSIEVGKTSSEAFASRFSGLVSKAQKRLLVVDSPFLVANDLRLAASRGVSVEVISNKDEANPTLTQNLEANGIKVHLLDPEAFYEINPRFMVSDGKDVVVMAVKKGEYAYVERTTYLGRKFSKDFEQLTESV